MMETRSHDDQLRDQPLPDLLRQLSEQTTTLMRQELELAKAEMRQKGKLAGIGAGAFGAAGLFGLFAFGALTACFVLALATLVEPWLAALIVTVVYAAVAGVLALTGKSTIDQATPPTPERAVDSTREDLEWTKQRARTARQ
jgi:membrane protein